VPVMVGGMLLLTSVFIATAVALISSIMVRDS
jgi:hypothetical protein